MADVIKQNIDVNAELERRSESITASVDTKARTFEASMSSEIPVLRRTDSVPGLEKVITSEAFYEVLGHQAGEYDFSRFEKNGPLLFEHDWTNHIGSVSAVRVEDGKSYGRSKFSRNAFAEEKMRDVEDGILDGTSLGYSVKKYMQMGEQDGYPLLRAVDWMARELSLTPRAADITVGVGRNDNQNQEAVIIMEKEIQNEGTRTEQLATGKTIDFEAERKKGVESERKRAEGVEKAIELAESKGLVIPEGTRSKASGEDWNGDRTCAHIIENQPKERIHTDTRVLDEMQRGERRAFSLCRAISDSMKHGTPQGFEAEVIAEFQKSTGQRASEGGLVIPFACLSPRNAYEAQRSMLAGDFAKGGATVPVSTGPMIPKLDPVPVVERAGATMIRGLTAPTNFPRHTTAAVASWVAEAKEVAASTPGTDDVMVTPHGLAAYVEIGRQLAITSSIDIEAFVRGEIIRRINLAIDKAALVGSGVLGVPKGIFALAAASTNEVAFGAAPAWAKIIEFESKIEDQDGLEGTINWITSAPVKGAWKATSKDTGSGQFLASENNTANGYPILVTSQLRGTTYEDRAVFGNWAQMIVGMYGSIELFIDQSAALQRKGLIGITGLAHADVAIRQGKAFARSSDKGNQ